MMKFIKKEKGKIKGAMNQLLTTIFGNTSVLIASL